MRIPGRRLNIAAIAVATVAGVVLAGCGSSTNTGSNNSSASQTNDATSGSAAPGNAATPGQKLKSIKVTVGRQPWAAENSPITTYMRDHKLFENAAKQFGYDLTVEYKDFPAAGPMVPEMIAGRLDFGMWGDTPTLTAIAQNQPLSVISVGEGHMRFLVATHKSSGITSLKDLKGKTVGVLLGGDPELAFLGMLKGVLGTSDTAALGIKMVNLPTQAIASTVPKGVDATVVIYPALLKEQEKNKDIVAIADSYGYTEPGYDGPSGKGAGIQLPGAKDSPFAPEGFYIHRSMWVTRDALIKSDPGVVSAFLAAENEAVVALGKMKPADVSNLVTKYWGLSPDDGAKIVSDGLVFKRGWSWATRGDAIALLKLSQVMSSNKIVKAPLTWDQLKANFAKSADVAKAAYSAAGSVPDASAFQPTKDDARGDPSWKVEAWAAPSSSGQ